MGLVRGIMQADKDMKYYEAMNRKRYVLLDEFEKDPVLIHPTRFDKRYQKLQW
jgi:hypothetical protein